MTTLKIRPASEVAVQKTTVFLYGPNGSGKTHFASTWPCPYFIVPEIATNELKTLAHTELPVITFGTMKEMGEQVSELAKQIRKGNLNDCKTIVFDNLTSTQMVAQKELEDQQDGKPLEGENWGVFTAFFVGLITMLHSLPVNVIWITHSKVRNIRPPGGGKAYAQGSNALIGYSRDLFPGHADMILLSDVLDRGTYKQEFYIYLKQRDIWSARVRQEPTRFDEMPAKIGPDPHYDELAGLMGWQSCEEIEKEVLVEQDTDKKKKKTKNG